ncbi:MAG: type II secretion system protein GspD [Planctomycetota bacterium]|jgi:type IV pilus assembly protein PilQ
MYKTVKKYCRDWVLAFLIISLSISSFAVSAEQDSAAGQQEILTSARQRLKTRITYSCKELPIETVLMDLAEQAKVDIVKSPKVTGNVTAKVTGVSLEEALGNILAAHDYTYIATESMIRVMPISEIAVAREELVTRIYKVTYADADQVTNALGNFVSQRGKVALNKGTSHIIVTDTEGQIKGIDKFIEEIDHMTPQVLVEVRIYDITSSEGFELGAEWTAGRNTPLKTTEHRNVDIDTDFPTAAEKTTTFTETTSGNYRDADDVFPGPGDGSFTTTGTETESEALPLGTFFDTEVEQYTTRRRKPFVGGSFDRITGGTLSFSLLNDAVDIELALHILHKQVEAKLLANPRILVLDNETANFEIVREIPYREMVQVERAAAVTYTAYKNVGVHLNVTPHIARDGMIRLHIVPEFGVLVGLNPEGAPTIDTRRADTIALIRDGQTLAMSGLRKRETSRDISKIPVLGDIPLVGGLFKSETESVEINELVIFITTRIIIEPLLSEAEKKQFDATEFASPAMTKMRLERDNQLVAEVVEPDDEPDIKESLEQFLQRLKTPE